MSDANTNRIEGSGGVLRAEAQGPGRGASVERRMLNLATLARFS